MRSRAVRYPTRSVSDRDFGTLRPGPLDHCRFPTSRRTLRTRVFPASVVAASANDVRPSGCVRGAGVEQNPGAAPDAQQAASEEKGMRRLGTKLLIGLVVAVALALGASSDMRAAAKAAAKATVTATTPVATRTPPPSPPAKASAKTVKPKATPAPAAADSVLPSTPLPGTTLAAAAPVPQAGAAQGKVHPGRGVDARSSRRSRLPTRRPPPCAPGRSGSGLAWLVGTASPPRCAGAPAGGAGAFAAPLPGIEGPGGIPHYFGPYGNWAFSPLPKGGIAEVTILDGGTGYSQSHHRRRRRVWHRGERRPFPRPRWVASSRPP